MEMGSTLGVAMEAGLLPFGDFMGMKDAISGIVSGSYLGKIMGQGAATTGKVLGVERVPVVKGQSLSAYDPRALKGTGVTYSTSPMGADHTAGNCLPSRRGPDARNPDGQIVLSRDTQVIAMVCDMLGFCIFVGVVPENLPLFATLASAFTGKEISSEMLLEQARQILKTEQAFNREAGISEAQNDLPIYFRTEPLPNNGLVFDVPFEELKEFSF